MTQQKLPHLQLDGYTSPWFSGSAPIMGVDVQEKLAELTLVPRAHPYAGPTVTVTQGRRVPIL